MSEIVIKCTEDIPNLEALEACVTFIYRNYMNTAYLTKRQIETTRGMVLDVSEKRHPNQDVSVCSVIFEVTKTK